jgi:hypothetical protein
VGGLADALDAATTRAAQSLCQFVIEMVWRAIHAGALPKRPAQRVDIVPVSVPWGA